MNYLQGKNELAFTVNDGMVTSINGISNTSNSYWMLYTSDTDNANSDWGTYKRRRRYLRLGNARRGSVRHQGELYLRVGLSNLFDLLKTAKDIAIIGVYTALMIGAQFALSAISGVELVTVLFFEFLLCFGVTRGIVVANAFSLLRCFVFGFFPTYLYCIWCTTIYSRLYSGFWVNGVSVKSERGRRYITVLTAIVMTVFFTALDDIITPLYYGYSLLTRQRRTRSPLLRQ